MSSVKWDIRGSLGVCVFGLLWLAGACVVAVFDMYPMQGRVKVVVVVVSLGLGRKFIQYGRVHRNALRQLNYLYRTLGRDTMELMASVYHQAEQCLVVAWPGFLAESQVYQEDGLIFRVDRYWVKGSRQNRYCVGFIGDTLRARNSWGLRVVQEFDLTNLEDAVRRRFRVALVEYKDGRITRAEVLPLRLVPFLVSGWSLPSPDAIATFAELQFVDRALRQAREQSEGGVEIGPSIVGAAGSADKGVVVSPSCRSG